MESAADGRAHEGWVTGKELREYFEKELETVYSKDPYKLNGGWGVRSSGLVLEFKARADLNQRVVSLKVNGKEIEPDAHYTIAGCEREGEALDVICRHAGTHDAKIVGPSVHDALASYFAAHPVIAPRRDGRERAVDLPDMVFSQDAVLAGGDISQAPSTPDGLPGKPEWEPPMTKG